MKKLKTLMCAAAGIAAVQSIFPYCVNAEDDVVYGKMNIPYAEFYSGEGVGYEVDAVSSATTKKWKKNEEGALFEGTFNQGNEDGTGTILGVTYPVAISKSDLESLGESNYSFTPLESKPEAYKNVTVSEGSVSFSGVQDDTPETASGSAVKLSTATAWGDYLIDVENKPEMGVIYGALIKTTDGKTYGMRHEENIWRGELAWSSGIVTTEPHGNTLSYKNFESLMGATINEVVFITADGYVSVETDTYVPVKFNSEIKINDANSGSGSTYMELSGIPSDYDAEYAVGEGFSVSGTQLNYTDAMPGQYTLTISDKNKKYADLSSDFVLSTDSVPADYNDGSVVKAKDADEKDYENFIKNITKVSVNGTEYSASGKKSVKIIREDGTIDFSAVSGDKNVFDGSGRYDLSVQSTGYNNSLDISISSENENTALVTTASAVLTEANKQNNTTAAATTTAKTASVNKTESTPKTGVKGVALPVALLAVSAFVATVLKKKNNI